jgi:hypothetical protein
MKVNARRTIMKKITVVALTALLLLGASIVQAYVPSGYLIVPDHHGGVLGDNDITVTATALEAGYQYRIKLNVGYHPNPRTPPGKNDPQPAGYTEWSEPFSVDSDGGEVTLTYTVPLPDCHWQIIACFTLQYLRSDGIWVWNGDERATGCVDIWSDCHKGCTPGFWKNHLDAWPTGYSPDDDFDATFGVDLFDPDITLEEAVNAKGGKENKLARHGTAALLDAAHPHVDYPYSMAEVIAAVQAGDADTLVAANEGFCPLD